MRAKAIAWPAFEPEGDIPRLLIFRDEGWSTCPHCGKLKPFTLVRLPYRGGPELELQPGVCCWPYAGGQVALAKTANEARNVAANWLAELDLDPEADLEAEMIMSPELGMRYTFPIRYGADFLARAAFDPDRLAEECGLVAEAEASQGWHR